MARPYELRDGRRRSSSSRSVGGEPFTRSGRWTLGAPLSQSTPRRGPGLEYPVESALLGEWAQPDHAIVTHIADASQAIRGEGPSNTQISGEAPS